MTSAKILADSINPAGVRLTSWLLTYPRFIHSEMMTHRVYSRNAASSRAIPWKKVLESIKSNPAFPAQWGLEQKGMQSGEEIGVLQKALVEGDWLEARDCMVRIASVMAERGIHKGIVNRLLEPFVHMTALFTTTDHRNFFALRAHKDADKTFQALAFPMLELYLSRSPQPLGWGSWHIPNFGERDLSLSEETFLKIATARCARLSYLTHEGDHSVEKDLQKHDDLAAAGHWSPFEHCAQAHETIHYPWSNFDQPGRESCNSYITGISHWMQYRKFFPDENRTNVDLHAILADKPAWLK